jgi:hypothetical protein
VPDVVLKIGDSLVVALEPQRFLTKSPVRRISYCMKGTC